jgi:hypothetical protein
MSGKIYLDIIHKACALLGVEMGVSRASTATRAEKLAHTFIESAMEEAYTACPWPFSLAQFRNYVPHNPLVFEKVKLRDERVPEENQNCINDCMAVLVIAPSQSREWYIDASQHFWIKGGKIDACFYQSSLILYEIMGKKRSTPQTSYCDASVCGASVHTVDGENFEIEEMVPDLYATLSSFNLAANAAYSLQSDAAFADGLRLQYMKKLEECKRQVRIDGFIQNAYRSL